MTTNYSTLVGLFADIVRTYPGRIALKDRKRALSYQELYRAACIVAEKLRQSEIPAGSRVVCISRKNVDSLVCFWGILIMGCIPVMLDHLDGTATNEAKIAEVKAAAIILDETGHPLSDGCPLALRFDLAGIVGEAGEETGAQDRPDPGEVSYPEVCYILLTSGTTGKPKAVQISHNNVLHYTFSIYEKLGRPVDVRAIHASTFAADLGLTNLLVALVSGGMLRILDKEEATDPALFNEIIAKDRISLLKITPSHLLALVSDCNTPYLHPIENIILGGEKLSWEIVKAIFSLGICHNLYNHYGPTETTIGAVAFKIETSSPHFDRTGSVPLGAPLGMGRCFLPDAVDDIGELCITGPGVSIGYFENEVENKKKFMTREIDGVETLCYRTGDICRGLGDGNYEFLYRTDRQVKVKGYRIELGEIELMIAGHPAVEAVIASISEIQGHSIIDVYIKLIRGGQPDGNFLRKWLSDRLPSHKIPSNFYFYTKAPYNSNGKIDLNALKKMFNVQCNDNREGCEEAKEDSWEDLAVASWKKILNKAEIMAGDHFFETGGDSLMAIQLIGRLQRNGFQIHVADLNRHPVFGDFAAIRPSRIAQDKKPVGIGKPRNNYTFSQIAFLQHEEFDLNKYCQTILLETEDKIRVREMALALNYVLESHAELNTKFKKSAGSYLKERKQDPSLELGISILDGRKPVIMQIQDVCHHLLNGISLKEGVLFAAHVFVDNGGKDYLYLVCHHLGVDVISWNIIIDELLDYYEQVLSNEHPVIAIENMIDQFYSNSSRHADVPAAIEAAFSAPIRKLPGTSPEEGVPGPVTVCRIGIPPEISGALRSLGDHSSSMTAGSFLLSALGKAVLNAYDIPEISIDLEFHGRPQQEDLPDLSRSVGWWAVTLPVIFSKDSQEPADCMTLMEENGRLACGVNLLHDLLPDLSTERADIRLNYLGYFPDSFGNGFIRMKPSSFNSGTTRSLRAQQEYQLYFTARFIGDALIIDVQYQRHRRSRTIVDNIIRGFFTALMESLSNVLADGGTIPLCVQESNLPSVGQPLYHILSGGGSPLRQKIFLTGATGFLGTHLAEVLSRTEACEVYCLVRGDDQEHAERRLEGSIRHFFYGVPEERKKRLHILRGDILAEGLGMTRTHYDQIVNEADLIIHAAADINLLKDYAELSGTNIVATRNIIEFAKKGKKKALNYISTLAVSGYPTNDLYKHFSEDDLDYGQSFISNYEKSKFDAEKMVLQFLEKEGDGRIYRVGHIAADSVDGKFQQNIGQNRIFQLIKGFLLLKMIPETYVESLSFSYVDVVAEAIALFSTNEGAGGGMKCVHVDNPQYVSFLKIAEMLQQMGYELDLVDLGAFRNAVAAFEGSLGDKSCIALMENWVRRATDLPRRVRYIHRRSVDLMGQAGLYFPKLRMEWLSSVIREGIKAGYFHSPALVSDPSPLLSDAEIF